MSAGAVLLWMLMPLVAIVGYGWFTLRALSFAGCASDCLPIVYTAYAVLPWALVLAFPTAIVFGIVLWLLGRRAVWAPATGVALLLVSLVGMGVATHIGFAPMYERNERALRGELTPAPVTPPDPVGRWGTGSAGDPQLQFAADGTLSGTDGCHPLAGTWRQDEDGVIDLAWTALSSDTCPGVLVWFGGVERARVIDDYLTVQNATGDTVGGLPPSR